MAKKPYNLVDLLEDMVQQAQYEISVLEQVVNTKRAGLVRLVEQRDEVRAKERLKRPECAPGRHVSVGGGFNNETCEKCGRKIKWIAKRKRYE